MGRHSGYLVRSAATALGAAMCVSAGLAACDSDDNNGAVAVCVDTAGNRVPDGQCGALSGNGMSGFEWYYIMSTLNQPRYGAQVVHNTYYSSTTVNRYAGFSRPANATVYNGVPASGYTPPKGSAGFVPKGSANVYKPGGSIVQSHWSTFKQKVGSNSPIRIGRR